MFRNAYVYTNTYMHTITIDKKKGHEIEGEQGGGQRFGGRPVIIKLQSQKQILKGEKYC